MILNLRFSHTPTEICDDEIPYDPGAGRLPMFDYAADLESPSANRLFELGMRNAISRRMVMEVQDASFPGSVGWDANTSGYSNMSEYSPQRPSLFGWAVEQAFVHHYKLRDAFNSVSVKVLQQSDRRQKPCIQERHLDICL